jgi:hypothetical protein
MTKSEVSKMPTIPNLPQEVLLNISKNLDIKTYCNSLDVFNPSNFDVYCYLKNKTLFGSHQYYEDIDYKSILLLVNRGGLFNKSLKHLTKCNRVTGHGEEIFIKANCKGHFPCICQNEL